MRVFGLLLCIVGVLIAGGGIIAYFGDREGVGIAGMVVGGCFLGIGVMIFLTDLILRLFRRSAKLTIHFEMGSPEGEGGWVEDGRVEDGRLEEGVGETPLSRWDE